MRKNKLPEFMLLLEQFFTEYMPLSSGLSQNTVRSYKHSFRLLFQYVYQTKKKEAGEIRFRDLDFETVDGFLKWIETERGCSVSTRNLRLSALSSFAAYAQNRNFEAATVFANAVRRIPVKKQSVQPRIAFYLDEVSALLRLPDPEKRLGLRDQVLLNLMYASGARAQEICDLKVRDFFVEKNLYKLTVTGKGNKARRIVLAKPSGILLKRYLEETGHAGQLEAYIFSSQTHPQMTISCIEEIYKKYIAIARAEHPGMFLEKSYTPHTMRHTTATHMLEAGVPIVAIKNFLGHSSISTTERYAELSQGAVNRHIRDWNEKWFSHQKETHANQKKENPLPDFLK
ncbi:tyrosine-type recombinase/integrase [Enterocloster clostridioformis]|uniref:tyrosine-type recombinase/integrase n=1 Tax=Enterocloster clostridioformis TaxID=1531 RepID=UPI0034A2DEB1